MLHLQFRNLALQAVYIFLSLDFALDDKFGYSCLYAIYCKKNRCIFIIMHIPKNCFPFPPWNEEIVASQSVYFLLVITQPIIYKRFTTNYTLICKKKNRI